MSIQRLFLFESAKSSRWRYPAVVQRWLERTKLPALDLSCQLVWKHWNSRLGHWEDLRPRPNANSVFAPALCWGADFGSLADCQQSARHLSLVLPQTAMWRAHR